MHKINELYHIKLAHLLFLLIFSLHVPKIPLSLSTMRLPCVCCEPLRIPLISFSLSSHSPSLSLFRCEKSDTRANCQRGYPCHLPLTSRGGAGHVARSRGTSILYQSSGAPANGHREAFIYLPSKKSRQIPTLSCC